MQQKNGIIIGRKNYGENKVILKILTESDILIQGIVTERQKHNADYQIGNLAEISYKEKPGLAIFKLNIISYFGLKIMDNSFKLNLVMTLGFLINEIFAENEKLENLYDATFNWLKDLTRNSLKKVIYDYLNIEILILQLAGIGLDFKKCAITNFTENLYYLSPKTGKAATYEAGKKFHDKLFIIPEIFKKNEFDIEEIDIKDFSMGLNITGYFLNKHLNSLDKNLPIQRSFVKEKMSEIEKN